MEDNDIIPAAVKTDIKPNRRRDLLPWWIKAFVWLFLIFCVAMPVAIIMGLLGYDLKMSLLGLETNQPFSVTGIAIIILFIFKGFVAFTLWQEKTGAIKLAKADAILSAIICLFAMLYSIFGPGHSFSLRLELVVLFFYYQKLEKIQYEWENFNYTALNELPISEVDEPLE